MDKPLDVTAAQEWANDWLKNQGLLPTSQWDRLDNAARCLIALAGAWGETQKRLRGAWNEMLIAEIAARHGLEGK